MADKEDTKEAPPVAGFQIHDPKGMWFRSNAAFDMEDPTPVWKAGGSPTKLNRFVAGSYTQAESTSWTEAQWRAGILTKYSGRPGDDGTKEIVYVEPKPTEAPKVGAVDASKK